MKGTILVLHIIHSNLLQTTDLYISVRLFLFPFQIICCCHVIVSMLDFAHTHPKPHGVASKGAAKILKCRDNFIQLLSGQ